MHLDGNVGSGGSAEGDALQGIENLIGSAFDDSLHGNHLDNHIYGGRGNDKLYGYSGTGTLEGESGNDTLFGGKGNDRLAGDLDNDTLIGGGGADVLDGGEGTDIADYSASTDAVQIYLDGTAGTGGHAAGDTLSNIENLIGSSYADTLTGDDAENVIESGGGNDRLFGGSGNDTLDGGGGMDMLTGGGGADILDGGRGMDTADYSSSTEAVQISLDGTAGTGGAAAGDMLRNIENLIGSAYGDSLTGDDGDNMITAGAGADRLEGRDGDDVLTGGEGTDTLDGGDGVDTADYSASANAVQISLDGTVGTGSHAEGDTLSNIENLIGSAYADTLFGDDGDNVIESEAGEDVLDGGDGTDTASYINSDVRVHVDLKNPHQFFGHAQGDTLTNFENITGSDYGDFLHGDDGDNIIVAGAGADRLEGRDGDDVLIGGAGADVMLGDGGSDTADYSASDAGIEVRLNGSTSSGGHAQGDILISIENLIGSAYADILRGNNADNILTGGAGADTLTGGDGIDRFALKLDANAGTDTITDFSAGEGDRLLVDTANGNETSLAGLGITAQENGNDTANADLVYSNTVIATLNGVDYNDITDANFGNYFEVV